MTVLRHTCTCEWADDIGDPEVGPDPYMVQVDEQCPTHGREADPDAWAEHEAQERAWLMSTVQATLRHRGSWLDLGDGDVALVEHLYDVALARVNRERGGDSDGHNGDRAVGLVVAALLVLHNQAVGR